MQHRCLIVEDAPPVRLTLRRFLERNGIAPDNVLEVGSLGEARGAVARFDPEIIFLDLRLPDGQAHEEGIWMVDSGRQVVLLTSLYRDDPRVDLLVSHGAYDYIQKPVRQDDVKRVLRLFEREQGMVQRLA